MGISVIMVVVVSVAIIQRSNILQLVHAATLWAALNWTVARCGQPDDIVGVDWVTRTANILLVAIGLDSNGILESSCPTQPAVRSVDWPYGAIRRAYPCAKRLVASCRRHRCPASFPRFPIARDRWPGRDRWEWFQVYHPVAEDLGSP